LLKAVCSNNNFIKGNYNINFMEKEFAHELQSSTVSSDDIENAVVIISSLLKIRNSTTEIRNSITDNNKWTELQYE
jgi:hypothetical protein